MSVHKDKKTGLYYFRVRLKNNLGQSKQYKRRGFVLRKEAQEAERNFINAHSPICSLSLFQVFQIYEQDKRPQLRRSSWQSKEYKFIKRIFPYFADEKIENITPKKLNEWINTLIADGFSDKYIKLLRGEFSALLNYCVTFHGLKENPFTRLKTTKNPHKLKTPNAFNVWGIDDYKKTMNVLTCPTEKMALTLAFWTGIRKGELYALTWADFDEKNNLLNVNKSVQRLKNGEADVTPPKNYTARIIELPSQVADDLKAYKVQNYKPTKTGTIFPFKKTLLGNIIKKGVELANVPHIRVHDLRHSHASVLIAQNFPIAYISKRLGHSKISMTLDVYTHFLEKRKGETIEKMEKLFN